MEREKIKYYLIVLMIKMILLLNNYFNSSQEFKPKSAMKTPSKINRSRLKNVSFDSKLYTSSPRSQANSSYINLRNRGYLTSDILGSKNITSDMIITKPNRVK